MSQIWLAGRTRAGAFQHWSSAGMDEGRAGSPLFDPQHYLSEHDDVAAQVGVDNFKAAYSHWVRFGIKEERQTGPDLETAFDRGGFILRANFATYREAGIKENLVRSAVAATLASDENLAIFDDQSPYHENGAATVYDSSFYSTLELVQLMHDAKISYSDLRRQLILDQRLPAVTVDKAIIFIIQKLSEVPPTLGKSR